jgi:hypothetical protein
MLSGRSCLIEPRSFPNRPSPSTQRCGRGQVSPACERTEWLRTRIRGQGLMVQIAHGVSIGAGRDVAKKKFVLSSTPRE